MTLFVLFSAMVGARPRYCRPSDHLVTVVGARRLRDGLSKRYWIRCRLCDLEHGPYTDWQAAWLAAWGAQIATRRRDKDRDRAPGSVIVDLAGEAGGNCELSSRARWSSSTTSRSSRR
jgi:hypothetical protein